MYSKGEKNHQIKTFRCLQVLDRSSNLCLRWTFINAASIRRVLGLRRVGDIIRKRERARKVTTTEHGAHKFSCASAGTAVPLWTSSVLQ